MRQTVMRQTAFTFFLPVLFLMPALSPIARATEPGRAAEQGRAEQVDVVEKALRDELERSMRKLRLEELDRPYFLAYRVEDVHTVSVEASLGSLLASDENRRRYLSVELRVGDYAFDNTNFFSFPSFGSSQIVQSFGGVTPLPIEDNYREIRRQVWLATDVAYKNALEDLAKKKAALQNKTRTESLADFSRAEAQEFRDETPTLRLERSRGEKLTRDLSRLLLDMPHIATSGVDYKASHARARYLNSEGTYFVRSSSDVVLAAKAALQAEDGQWIQDAWTAFGVEPDDLPDVETAAAGVRQMGHRLGELRRAELLERYNGPVLFEPAAAAELLAQVFVPRLLARRRPISGDDIGMMGGGDNDFQDRIGARVLPRFISLVDDATLSEASGQDLFGGYPIDDEGVSGQKTTLVERGFLRTLLSDRTPTLGVESSSGNRRAGGVAPSNLVFRVDKDGMTPEQLKKELLVWVEDRGADYGVIVRKISQPFFRALSGSFARMVSTGGEQGVSPMVAAYKVYPDGLEVLLRNVEISGMNVQSFREIVAGGARPEIFHRPFRPVSGNPFGGFAREIPLISLVTPALLFEELTLKKPSGEIPRLPAVPHPLWTK